MAEQQVLVAKRDREEVRQIASKLHAKLPRELRDEVYQYLVDDMLDLEETPKGLSAASDEEFVTSYYKVFCPFYVGHEVACEAAECYYATGVFEAWTDADTRDRFGDNGVESQGLPRLMRILWEDVFELGILPYKFIRHIHIRFDVDDVCPQMRTMWGEDLESDKFSRQELSNLEKVHRDLESMLSLVVDKAKLNIQVQIEPTLPGWHWRGEHKWRGLNPFEADSYRIEYFNVERSVLNVLEAMRKFLYDLKYAGASVTVLSDIYGHTERLNMQTLFHSSKEDWEKVSLQMYDAGRC
ncbi:hypothetical protein J4E80_008724 [Alternaria sp. BMP 0032]|nr:hypothetical protein J4E80_008724 [Alternaria sp. BMP 0032]